LATFDDTLTRTPKARYAVLLIEIVERDIKKLLYALRKLKIGKIIRAV
jgi:hypothetical protein